MKNIAHRFIVALICLLTASSSFAGQAPADQGGSLLLTLFIGFFALIIVFQLVPACLLFVGMLKGLFSREHKTEEKESQI